MDCCRPARGAQPQPACLLYTSSFKVQGRLVDLPVEEGQQVAQGDLLARLEDADYRQKVRIDEATVRVRESNLALQLAGTRGQRCV